MTRPKLTERQIEVFRTVMITGSLTAAAKQLHVSQPGLSVTLARFEDQLGIQLFERIAGRLAPTNEARQIFSEVERVYGQFDKLVDAIQAIARGDNATFRFGTTPSVGVRLIPQALRLLREQHSERIYFCDFLAQKDVRDYLWFDRGSCVTSIAKVSDPTVASTVVATGGLVCLLPRRHPLAKRKILSPQDLKEDVLISFEADTPHGRLIETAYKRAGVSRQVQVYVRFVESAISFVCEGIGVAIVDEFAAIRCTQLGLVAVPLEGSPDIPVYVYWCKFRPRARSTDEMVDALMQATQSFANSR
ncbi:LysR substrate-binding domain-containing protein [Ectopseudomonas oleovorans]|uniref:Putative RuBisCO transcriptional regulator n=1 Tax=Ectopseudomonas oleovorans (strain CECT 5344) TaxID=1182590 RepID=W6QWY6_ECTO5|nr:LysR substrate-binding domain-containing protein [Pseudomonas oleovorans]CDM40488.1 putative RuBisCO transcriptional regulator [Pseudomonas oleovorans CECT 5344]CDR91118.1 putative RuBisCO transcriptional regulator [Pseudomonas oleovorans]